MWKTYKIIDIACMGQWPYRPDVTWAYVAIHITDSDHSPRVPIKAHGLPLHRPKSRWAVKQIHKSLKPKFHKIIDGANWAGTFSSDPLFSK